MATTIGNIAIQLSANIAKFSQDMNAANKKLDGFSKTAENTKKVLGTLFAGITAGIGANEIIKIADAYTSVENRLKLVTESTEELNDIQSKLFDTAQQTRFQFEATADLYTQLSLSTKQLSIAQEELLVVTKAINQAIAISGAPIESANAAIFQLRQGLAAGALRGQELNSVLEQTPRVAQAIADGLGVTIGELRTLGSEGALNAEKVIDAIQSQADVLEREFGLATVTVAQSLTILRNEFGKYISETDKSIGVTNALSKSIIFVSENIEEIITLVTLASAAIGSKYVNALISSTAETIRALQVEKASALAKLDSIRATRQQTLAELENSAVVKAQIIAERELELVRLKAQITDIGRSQSLARLIEIRKAEIAIMRAQQLQETNLIAVNEQFTKSTIKASLATTRFAKALARLGGPIGIITTVATAFFILKTNTDEATESLKNFNDESQKATETQTQTFIRNTEAEIARLKISIENATKGLDGLGVKIAGVAQQKALQERIKEDSAALKLLEENLENLRLARLRESGDTEKWAAQQAESLKELRSVLARLYPAESAAIQWLNDFKLLSTFLSGPELEQAIQELNAKFAGIPEEDDSVEKWAEQQAAALGRLSGLLDDLFPDQAAGRDYLESFQLLTEYLEGPELERALFGLNAKFNKPIESMNEAMFRMGMTFKEITKNMDQQFGDVIADAILDTRSLEDGLRNMARTFAHEMISAFVAIMAKRAVMWALEKAGLIELAAAGASAAATTTLATAGTNVPVAIAGMAAAAAASKSIFGVAHDGLSYVPEDGTYLLQKGEKVVSNEDTKKLDQLLESGFNQPMNVVIKISAVDGQSVARMLATPPARRQIESFALRTVQDQYIRRGSRGGPLG